MKSFYDAIKEDGSLKTMAYKYLLDLYSNLDERMDLIEAEQRTVPPASNQHHYHQGRYDCLVKIKTFLRDNYHQKLPRRIRQHSFDNQ